LQQAHAAVEKAEWRLAFLATQQILRANPSHVEACRIMAQVMDRLQIPQAIYWYRRLSELEPQQQAHYVKWARAALQHSEYALAEQALRTFRDKWQDVAIYHHLMSSLQLALKRSDVAERESAEALRLQPTNTLYRLNLAIIQVGSTNAEVQSDARVVLEKLSGGSEHRTDALRALITDNLAQNATPKGLMFSKQLVNETEATITDRIQHLHLLHKLKDPGAEEYFDRVQKGIRTKPMEILEFTNWMIANDRTEDALKWLKELGLDVRNEVPTQMALVNCLTQKKDWLALESMLKRSLWEEMDFLRLATLARALKERGSIQRSHLQWNAAVTAASGRSESLFMLVRTVSSWDWTKETHDLLWVIARGRYNPKNALLALYRYYQAGGDTQGLYRALIRMIEIDPADDIARNNFAGVALLLNVNVDKAHQMATDLYEKDKGNPIFVSTYAYSLHLRGHTAEGRKLMEGLGNGLLERPPIAAYYAILLAADGAGEKARHYLDLAGTVTLLPQEKELLEMARKAARL
jgi:tetratricopeptide (TPR) repeat protein